MAEKKKAKKKGFGAAFSGKARKSRLDAMEAAAVGGPNRKKAKPKAKAKAKKK